MRITALPQVLIAASPTTRTPETASATTTTIFTPATTVLCTEVAPARVGSKTRAAAGAMPQNQPRRSTTKRLPATRAHNVGTTIARVAGAAAPAAEDSATAAAVDGEIAAADLVMEGFTAAGAVAGSVDSAVAAVSGASSPETAR